MSRQYIWKAGAVVTAAVAVGAGAQAATAANVYSGYTRVGSVTLGYGGKYNVSRSYSRIGYVSQSYLLEQAPIPDLTQRWTQRWRVPPVGPQGRTTVGRESTRGESLRSMDVNRALPRARRRALSLGARRRGGRYYRRS
jgi:hypothetical protein